MSIPRNPGALGHSSQAARSEDLTAAIDDVLGTGSEPHKGSGATGDFAAGLAIAGRVYRLFDAKFAELCPAAARWDEEG